MYQLRLKEYFINSTKVTNTESAYEVSLYLLEATTLQFLHIETWQDNRPPDNVRIKEVKREIESSGRVQGIIALACLNNKMVCYDGNHRRLALLEILKDFPPHLSDVEIADTKSINVLISVIWNSSELSIYNEYALLNKSISVPLIYMRRPDKPIKTNDPSNIISEYIVSLVKNYPKFSSPSKSCRAPNFNRDSLTDDILTLCKEYKKKDLKVENLKDILNEMNESYKLEKYEFRSDTLKKPVFDKCTSGGLWLFCGGRCIDRVYFKQVFQHFYTY